jgi:hypothetical protein
VILKLAMVSIQHDFCHVQNNWKNGTGKSQTSLSSRQLGTLKNKKYNYVRLEKYRK